MLMEENRMRSMQYETDQRIDVLNLRLEEDPGNLELRRELADTFAKAGRLQKAIPSYEDVRAVAPAVLAHRLVLNFEAEADGRGTRDVIGELLEESKAWT